MNESELVFNFQRAELELKSLGYKVSPVNQSFFVYSEKGTIVADVKTVDGLRGFAQGIQWSKEKQ